MTLIRFIGDWLYAIYVTLRPSKATPLAPVTEPVPTEPVEVQPAPVTVAVPQVSEQTTASPVVAEPVTTTTEEVNADSQSI